MKKEPQAIRFGMRAVKKGFVTPENAVKALKIQENEKSSTGKSRPIGRILLNEGHITLQQMGEVLRGPQAFGEDVQLGEGVTQLLGCS